MRDRVQTILNDHLDEMPESLKEMSLEWIENRKSAEITRRLQKPMVAELEKIDAPYAKEYSQLKSIS